VTERNDTTGRDPAGTRADSDLPLAAYAKLLRHSPHLVGLLSPLGAIEYLSPAAVDHLCGQDADDDWNTQRGLDAIHPDDVDLAAQAFLDALAQPGVPVTFAHRTIHASGRVRNIIGTFRNLIDDPDVGGIALYCADVTDHEQLAEELRARDAEQQRAHASLHDARMRFEEVFEHAPIGMAVAELTGRFFRVNPAFCEMLGYTAEEMVGRTFAEFTHPDDLSENLLLHDGCRTGERQDYMIDKRYRRRDGSYVWCRVNVGVVRSADGEPLYQIGQVTDISEHKSNADALEREARYDVLTGLATRKLFLEALERELLAARRRTTTLAVLFIDLDHFKHVNDTLGHSAGDELLTAAAKRLKSVLRASDLACRFGGDEFVVLCPDLADPADVASVAERVRAVLEQPFRIRDTDLFLGASIGIAIADESSASDLLLSQADSAAYRAKARGRNRYEVFDEELRTNISNRLATEQALRRAIERRELVLEYQPVVETTSGAVRSFEALLRWNRPGVGLVFPGDFLEVAEDRDLIVPIGYQVLEIACAQLAAWKHAGPDGTTPHVAVNVSARQFAHPEFAERVEKIVTAAGVDPTTLSLELTESTLMDDMIATSGALRRLRSFGIELAIDDFGTGYSSLSYLRRMPVSIVKIDRSFVLELGDAAAGSAIVASVIQLAHALGMRVVAEGVDSAERIASLVALGCDYIQGFYFTPALPPAEALAYMHHKHTTIT
jgi:diguanylate cyclase (GGDEF)-like protein/PAS domain S-box-containing protein